MPLVKFPNCGRVGIVKDLSQHELPLEAWTDGANVRFLDGYAQQFLGHAPLYGSPSVAPLHVLPVNAGGRRWWLYAGAAKVYGVTAVGDVDQHVNLTRTKTEIELRYAPGQPFGALGINAGTVGIGGEAFAGLQPGALNNAQSTHAPAPNFSLSALQPGLLPANAPTGQTATLVAVVAVNDDNYSARPNQWTSTVLGGIPILNPGNLVDPPQQWNLDAGARLRTLDNWPAGWFCKSLRTYKSFLVALGNTDDRGSLPLLVKWSAAAEPGAVPATWDGSDRTREAGEADLAEGGDPIIDGLQLRDSFMIYKEQSVWRMDYVGGEYTMRFQKVLGVSGAMNRNCVVELDGWHFVLTGSDVVIHDGQTATQVLDKQARRALFQDMDVDAQDRAFVFKNPFLNEVFICYASVGYSVPNRALVWNYKDKTVAYRDLPSVHHANYGPVASVSGDTWESDNDPWSSDMTLWNGPAFTPDTVRVLMASDGGKLQMLDASASFDGAMPAAFLERRGLSYGTPEQVKMVRSLRPRIRGNPGDTVTIKIGGQDDPFAEPLYETMTFTIGVDLKVDCFVTGRYIAIWIGSGTAYQWRLDSLDLDIVTMGAY